MVKQPTKPITKLSEWFETRKTLETHTSIGFVPTMGALHAGHASLLARARQENDLVVLSIYVNPTQFDNQEDFDKYPATLESDCVIAAKAGVDYVLAPTYPQMYPDQYRYRVSEGELSRTMEGAHRPGHFDGMLTVVLKLLQLVRAQRAYFGEKDYQQLQLVKGMAEAFFLETEIVACPTVREADGLAMSSRNVRLTEQERELAPVFYKTLVTAPDTKSAVQALTSAGFEVDYVEDIGFRRFGAVKLGNVRLIDNVER